MTPSPFDIDSQARHYAKTHYRSDAGVQEIYYLPSETPDRTIRFIEVNNLMAEMRDDCLEPFELTADRGSHTEHHISILDVTPAQWDRINARQITLPEGWALGAANLIEKPAFNE